MFFRCIGADGKRGRLSTFARNILETRLMVVFSAPRHSVFDYAPGSPWPYRLPVLHANLYRVCCLRSLSRHAHQWAKMITKPFALYCQHLTCSWTARLFCNLTLWRSRAQLIDVGSRARFPSSVTSQKLQQLNNRAEFLRHAAPLPMRFRLLAGWKHVFHLIRSMSRTERRHFTLLFQGFQRALPSVDWHMIFLPDHRVAYD